MTAAAGSALYRGVVVHRRLRPVSHRLQYRVFSLALDLDDLPRLDRDLKLFGWNRPALLSFYDRDHGPGDGGPLGPWVRDHAAAHGLDAAGPVTILCFPRVLGFAFNPLTVYFLHDRNGALSGALHQVSNTFGERHCYLIPATADHSGLMRQSCDKAFYVSPFMPMDTRYHFRIVPPGEKLAVAIRQTDQAGAVLHAALTAERRPLTDAELFAAWARHPLMTLKVVAGIQWEALALWRKGLRLLPRPPAPERLVSFIPQIIPPSVDHAATRASSQPPPSAL